MKILYIITGLGMGGAETVVTNLATSFSEKKHTVSIISLTGENSFNIDNKIAVYNLHIIKNAIGFVQGLKTAKKIIKIIQPDVVHAHMFHAVFFARILRLFYPLKKLICTEHSKNIESSTRMFLYWLTDFLSDCNTNVSKEATEYFIKKKAFSSKKSVTVYNGIDLSHFYKAELYKSAIREKLKLPPENFLFINVSRLMPAKDHKNLIDAFDILLKKYTNTKLICVGDGELRTELTKYARIKKLTEYVLFTGSQHNVEEYYNASDCFVLSSAWEGFGLVLAEAMACELPVITTDCGGTTEVVQNFDYIVPPHNPRLLANKMIQLYENTPEEREQIGRQNRELAKKFDINKIVDQWLFIYQSR